MNQLSLKKHRINKLDLPAIFDTDKIQIGIPVKKEEAQKVGLHNLGDVVVPSAAFGVCCNRNSNGYSYPDTTKPKEMKYVSTNWVHPFGNLFAAEIPVDIYRPCYPRTEVAPTEIELTLVEDAAGNKYVSAILTEEVRKLYIKEAINLFLEIYGWCVVYENEFTVPNTVHTRCGWEILPPGEKPNQHLKRLIRSQGGDTSCYDVDRLEFLDKYKVEQIVEGKNGFYGYYAYIFSKHCVLESAIYGNASYIIPKENWEIMSRKTKKELLDREVVISKIIHTQNWKTEMRTVLRDLEGQ